MRYLSFIFIKLIFFNFSLKSNDFYEYMDLKSDLYKNKYSTYEMHENIKFLKNLYDKNHPDKMSKQYQKIPKIIHQIWVGPRPIPNQYKIWQNTWIKFHPNWKYILWTDKEVAQLSLYNKILYDKTTDYREKADILRYELLYQFGGIYTDLDSECLKPFDDLLYYDFFVGIIGNEHQPIFNNALVGSKPNNILLKKIIENIEDKEIDNWAWRSGVFYFSEQLMKLLKDNHDINIALPISFFYSIPFNYSQKEIKKYIHTKSMSLHYWGNKSGFNIK